MKNPLLTLTLVLVILTSIFSFGFGAYTLLKVEHLNQSVMSLSKQLDASDPQEMRLEEVGQMDQTSTPSALSEGEELTLTVESALQQAFASKYDRDPESVMVDVQANTGTYAKGLIKFEGEMSGGWFLAVKEDEWKIVADGNGTVNCSDVEAYDFPGEMVPSCWDQEAMELIERE